jgi:hypothetical protein
MALNRIRANVRYSKSSGMATWSRDQMSVRYDQAVTIKPDLANEEQPQNRVEEDPTSTDHEVFVCDLPLEDATAAEDAFATLSDASVFGYYAEDFQDGDMTSPSWIEHHKCRHDETPQKPCEVIDKVTSS